MKAQLIYLIAFITLLSCNSNNSKVVGIQPFGDFETTLIDTISNTIKKVYGYEVIVLENRSMPRSAFVHIKKDKPRYRADTLIRILKKDKPNNVDIVLGLTAKDISTTKWDYSHKPRKVKIDPKGKYDYRDWRIFGLAFVSGKSCVVSTFSPKKSDMKNNTNKLVERIKKICIHEIGHNLGLKHCTADNKCVMRDAVELINTIDKVDLALCGTCLNII